MCNNVSRGIKSFSSSPGEGKIKPASKMEIVLKCPMNRNILIELYSRTDLKQTKFILYPGQSIKFNVADIWRIEYIA